MDEAIRKLKSTTFLGRRLTRRPIADVQRTARSFSGLSRNELAHTVCEHLNLHAPSGGNRVHTARRVLEQREELGILVLPDKDESKRREAGRGKMPLRLVNYEIAGSAYVLGTTLLDRRMYPVADLSDLYHERGGVEELYKVSKQLIDIEDFHGRSERGVRQELFAHFVLIALTRLFSNHGEGLLGGRREPRGATHGAEMPVNFNNRLLTVARHLEGLFLRHAPMLGETLRHILGAIVSCRQKTRPNRSSPRRSRKPIGKWKPEKPARAAASA